jgi:hypothetical protein
MSTGTQKGNNEAIINTLGLLGFIFAVIYIFFGSIGAFAGITQENFFEYSHFGIMLFLYYSVMLIEGILLIVLGSIMLKKLNYNVFFSIPIAIGINTIIMGLMQVNNRIISGDNNTATLYSKLILAGILLIIASYVSIKRLNYKKMIFMSVIIVIINIIIEIINLLDNIKYNFLSDIKVSGIYIGIQILFVIAFFLIILKKRNYKIMIFIPIIFGIVSILAGVVIFYKKYFDENSISSHFYDVIGLGTLIIGGILLIYLSFRIINKSK